MTRATHIVCTTIFEPAWLPGYLDNLRRHGHDGDTRISIIVDRKTPASVHEAAAAACADGFDVWCPTLDEQTAYLENLGAPADFVPWNTDNRRNIGFLHALEDGAERLISIDDDNYCSESEDFVGAHALCGAPAAAPGRQLATGGDWFNLCGLLDSDAAAIYPRGFPYAARRPERLARLAPLDGAEAARRIAINAGLWTGDPDVDAVARLAQRPHVHAGGGDVVLGAGTWSPINTQNTALIRDAVSAYYYVRMGYPLQGMRIDRYGDILSGYFVQACARHLGDTVHIGAPVAAHRRSTHNLFKDLYFELAGMVLIEDLMPWLREVKLSGDNYSDAYASLADALEAEAHHFSGFVWDEGGSDFLIDTAHHMHTWLALVQRFQ